MQGSLDLKLLVGTSYQHVGTPSSHEYRRRSHCSLCHNNAYTCNTARFSFDYTPVRGPFERLQRSLVPSNQKKKKRRKRKRYAWGGGLDSEHNKIPESAARIATVGWTFLARAKGLFRRFFVIVQERKSNCEGCGGEVDVVVGNPEGCGATYCHNNCHTLSFSSGHSSADLALYIHHKSRELTHARLRFPKRGAACTGIARGTHI